MNTDKNNLFKHTSGRNINSLQINSTPFPLNQAVHGSKPTVETVGYYRSPLRGLVVQNPPQSFAKPSAALIIILFLIVIVCRS
jgi:hypothetical protein